MSPNDFTWSADLIVKLKAKNDDTAWLLLYDNCTLELKKYAINLVDRFQLESTVKDLIQATFAVAMSKIVTFEVEDDNPAKIVHWLHRILFYEAIKEAKRLKSSRHYLSLDTEDHDLVKTIWGSETQPFDESLILKEAIIQALTPLLPSEQEIVIKLWGLGVSINDLAKELNLNPKSLSMKVYRIKKRIKLSLKLSEQKSLKNNLLESFITVNG